MRRLLVVLNLSGPRQGVCCAPSVVEPVLESAQRNILTRAPFRETQCNAIERQTTIALFVQRLLFWRSPPAVLRCVRAIVVDTVKARARRSLTHVREEVLKRGPSLADFYPSSTVPAKPSVGRVLATLPRLVLARLPLAVCSRLVEFPASARVRFTSAESIASCLDNGSAVADAKPFPSMLDFAGLTDDREPIKALPGKIDKRRHAAVTLPLGGDGHGGNMIRCAQ